MNLKKLSNEELLSAAKKLAAQEREILLSVLLHLKEIDSRGLYLKVGFSSLWAYCTEELGYAEGSAQRRIEAMRAIRDLPALEEKIESGVLSLSNVAKAQSTMRRQWQSVRAGHKITPETKLEVFARLENKNQAQAEKILATEFPEVVTVRERVRVVNSNETERKYIASNQLEAKLEKVRTLFSHKNSNPSQAELIEMMADFVIAQKDPAVKKLKPRTSPAMPQPPAVEIQISPPLRRQITKQVPNRTRSQVWQEAGGKCEYVDDKSGRRCNSRHKLEIEHVQPRAFGGSHERENLKLYCRAHNVMTAREATLMR